MDADAWVATYLRRYLPDAPHVLDGSFDLVYIRFLLEYLPDPARAVAEAARVCRAGGTVLLQDLDGQLLQHHPPDPTLQRQLETAIAGLGTTGFDPFVGRKLFALARAAGMSVRDLRVEPYHLIAGQADQDTRRLWSLKHTARLGAGKRSTTSLATGGSSAHFDPVRFGQSGDITISTS